MTPDNHRIWMESYREASDADYFDAHPELADRTHMQVFDAAFQLGWEAHRAASRHIPEGENKHDY